MRKKIGKVLIGLALGTFFCSSVALAGGTYNFNFMTSGSLASSSVAKRSNERYFWGSVDSSNLSSTKKITFYSAVNGAIHSGGYTSAGNGQFQATYHTVEYSAHQLIGVPNSVGPRANGSWTP